MASVVSFGSSKRGSMKAARLSGPPALARRGKMGQRRGTSVVSRAISHATRSSSKSGSAMSMTSSRRRRPAAPSSLRGVPNLPPIAACAYWDALNNVVPPSLTTTYGAYTCVNSVVRFTYTTAPNTPTQFMLVWNPTPNRVFLYTGPFTGIAAAQSWQQQQLKPNVNTLPLDIRPLRMSMRMCNTTAAINRSGSVTSALVPQSILQEYSAINQITPASWSAQWGLAQNSPQSRRLSCTELSKPHAFVMPPSSYLTYNTYLDYLPTTSDDGVFLNTVDFYSLVLGTVQPVLPPPLTYPNVPRGGFVGNIPTNNILLVNIEPNPLAQTYDLVVSCQDAVRYPANSLPASMAQKYIGGLTSDVLAQHTAQQASADNVHPADNMSIAGSVFGGMIGSRAGAAAGAVYGPAGIAAGSMIGGMMGSQAGAAAASRYSGNR